MRARPAGHEVQRSPCHDCSLAGEDKNGPQCLKCEKRCGYVASLEGRSGPVPMEMTDMAIKNDPEKSKRDDQFMRDNPDMPPAKLAEQLGRSLGAIYVRRSVLGLCKGKRNSPITKGAELQAPGEDPQENIINLEDHPDVLDQLRKRAAAELRTVSNQALWCIKCALQGGAPDHGRAPDSAP